MLAKCLDQYLALKTLNNHVAELRPLSLLSCCTQLTPHIYGRWSGIMYSSGAGLPGIKL